MDEYNYEDTYELQYNANIIEKKALKYVEKTGDFSLLKYVFEPFKGRNLLTKSPHLPGCNSLLIRKIQTAAGIVLHKSDEFIERRHQAITFLDNLISDDEINK